MPDLNSKVIGSLPKIDSCKAAISLSCPKKVMIERFLNRSRTSRRVDDNIMIYEKKYERYLKNPLPVVEHLEKTKVRLIKVRCVDQFPLMRTKQDRFPRQKMENRDESYSRKRSWYANKRAFKTY